MQNTLPFYYFMAENELDAHAALREGKVLLAFEDETVVVKHWALPIPQPENWDALIAPADTWAAAERAAVVQPTLPRKHFRDMNQSERNELLFAALRELDIVDEKGAVKHERSSPRNR